MATDQSSEANFSYLVTRLRRIFAPFALVPFNFVATVADLARMSGGQLRVGQTVAQGSPLVLAHNLARVPTGALVIDNGTTAQTLLQITARSSTSLTVVPLTAALSASSIIFVF